MGKGLCEVISSMRVAETHVRTVTYSSRQSDFAVASIAETTCPPSTWPEGRCRQSSQPEKRSEEPVEMQSLRSHPVWELRVAYYLKEIGSSILLVRCDSTLALLQSLREHRFLDHEIVSQ